MKRLENNTSAILWKGLGYQIEHKGLYDNRIRCFEKASMEQSLLRSIVILLQDE